MTNKYLIVEIGINVLMTYNSNISEKMQSKFTKFIVKFNFNIISVDKE